MAYRFVGFALFGVVFAGSLASVCWILGIFATQTCIDFLVSKFLGFLVSESLGFKVSWFQSFKVSKICQIFISCFREDIDPISNDGSSGWFGACLFVFLVSNILKFINSFFYKRYKLFID